MGTVFQNYVIIASAGLTRSIDTGTPFISVRYGDKNASGYVFTKAAGTAGATYNADELTLVVLDQNGNALANTAKFKIKLKYKEFLSF
jgi:hypothetical protein